MVLLLKGTQGTEGVAVSGGFALADNCAYFTEGQAGDEPQEDNFSLRSVQPSECSPDTCMCLRSDDLCFQIVLCPWHVRLGNIVPRDGRTLPPTTVGQQVARDPEQPGAEGTAPLSVARKGIHCLEKDLLGEVGGILVVVGSSTQVAVERGGVTATELAEGSGLGPSPPDQIAVFHRLLARHRKLFHHHVSPPSWLSLSC